MPPPQLPIRVLHSSVWKPTPLESLARTAARAALPSALVPSYLDDRYLVLHDASLAWCRLPRPAPLLVRAPLAAQRRASRALRRACKLGVRAGQGVTRRRGRAGGSLAVVEGGGAPLLGSALSGLGESSAVFGSTKVMLRREQEAADRAEEASVHSPVPYKPVLERVSDESVPIALSHIHSVKVVSYQTNEWEMTVQHTGSIGQVGGTATLRLQARSAAALNAWMHVLQPVLKLDAAGGAAPALVAEVALERHLSQLLRLKDAALEVAQAKTHQLAASATTRQVALSAAASAAATSRAVVLRHRGKGGAPKSPRRGGLDRRRRKSLSLDGANPRNNAWLPRSLVRKRSADALPLAASSSQT